MRKECFKVFVGDWYGFIKECVLKISLGFFKKLEFEGVLNVLKGINREKLFII